MIVAIPIAIGTRCSTDKKELDYAKLLKVKEAIERGSGNAIKKYGDIIGPEKLADIESNPEFIEIKNQALADLNGLIEEALEKGVDKEALVACIRENGADSPVCAKFVEEVRTNTSPRLQQYNADLKKFLANHLDKNSNLPKISDKCKTVHTGIFQEFVEGDTVVISRDESSEVEKYRGEMRVEKITWVNDCTYRLQVVSAETGGAAEKVSADFPDDCFIEIIKVTDDYYAFKIFEAVNGEMGDLVDIGKMYRVNKGR